MSIPGNPARPPVDQAVWEACGGAPAPAAEVVEVDAETFERKYAQADLAVRYDTASAHCFDSWKDSDLYRAIDLPENGEPGEAQDREIEEYAAELRRRYEERRDQIQREHALRIRHSIPEPPPARDGIFPADEA
jgi:hypothetical protein